MAELPNETRARFEDMRARIRAANQAEIRLDGGGDDSPPVYRDADTGQWVYRASAVGGLCERALWLARNGIERSPLPKTLARAFRESANNEELIIGEFVAMMDGVELLSTQERFEIDVHDNVIIRGHADARFMITGAGREPREAAGEAKAITEDGWRSRKVDMFPGWAEQVQLEMAGLGVRSNYVMYGEKVDGVVARVGYSMVNYQPAVVAKMKAKVRRVERAIADGTEVECPDEVWGCPFWQLHTEGSREVQKVDDQRALTLARDIALISDQIRRKDIERDAKRTELNAWMETNKLAGTISVGGQGSANRYRVTRVEESTQTRFDRRAAERDGVDLSKWLKESKTSGYVKVEVEDDDA